MNGTYEIHIGNKAYPVAKEVHELYYSLADVNRQLRADLAAARELLAEEDNQYAELRNYAISLEKKLGIDHQAEENK